MSSIIVGASNTFLLGIIWIPNPRRGDEMMPSVWLTHGTRFWSEMISYWVYKDRNTISIMKRNEWSTNSNSSSEWRYTFFFGVLFGYRILYCWPQSASHAFRQWDDFLLGILRLKHHFHYGKEWLVNRDICKATLESGRTVHTFSLVIRLYELNQEYNYTEKVKAHSAPPTNLRPNFNNPSKKDWNCPRLRRAEHLLPQFPTLFDFHYQTHITLNLKICNKTDLNVKNCLFSKNNCRNIWIIQIKVVTLHHQNNSNNN